MRDPKNQELNNKKYSIQTLFSDKFNPRMEEEIIAKYMRIAKVTLID